MPGDLIPNQNGHELYTRLFIVVSQDGENPPFKVYRLDKLISIGSISIREINTHMASLEFTEGPYGNRKTIRIELDSEDLSAKMATSNR